MKTAEEKANEFLDKNIGDLLGSPFDAAYNGFIAGYSEAMRCQSSPKVKQLEWVVSEGTETILANIPFNNYYLIDGVDSMIFLTINSQYHIGRYATIEEAKAAAQKDFEERVEKCIAK